MSPKSSSRTLNLTYLKEGPVRESDCPKVLNDYFSSILANEDPSNIPTLPEECYDLMSPVTVNTTGIIKLIEKLKLSPSAGLKNINAKFLKNTAAISRNFLNFILN